MEKEPRVDVSGDREVRCTICERVFRTSVVFPSCPNFLDHELILAGLPVREKVVPPTRGPSVKKAGVSKKKRKK